MALKKLGPYQLGRLIGQGGMGAVHEAIDERDGSRVAIKVLPAVRAHDEVFARRFEAEIATLIPLSHPNIVRILGHGRDQHRLFLAMELVEGGSLYEHHRRKRTLPWPEVVGYALDICKALRHAHDRGFIHRDLKLGNLLLDPQGRVKLTDFGIARYGGVERDDLREAITAPGGIVGTLDYMAPEQFLGEPATIRSDLYSLGIVMYVLLAGRPPFTFRSVPEAVETLRAGSATRLGTLVADLPTRLERLVMRLLDKDPSKRFGSAEAVTRRLMEIIDADADVSPQPVASEDGDDFELLDAPDRQRTELAADLLNASIPPGGFPLGNAVPRAAQDPTRVAKIASNPTQIGQDIPNPLESPPSRNTAKPDYYATVTDEDRRADAWRTEEPSSGPIWPHVAALTLVLSLLLAGLYWILLRNPSPDSAYERIAQALDEGIDPSEIETEISSFVEQHPDDPRTVQLRETLTEIDAMRLPKRLRNELRWRGPLALSDAEREFLVCLELAEVNPGQADQRLAALAATLLDDPDARSQRVRQAALTQRGSLELVLVEQLSERREGIARLVKQFAESPPQNEAERSAYLERVAAFQLRFNDDPRLTEDLRTLQSLAENLVSSSKPTPMP